MQKNFDQIQAIGPIRTWIGFHPAVISRFQTLSAVPSKYRQLEYKKEKLAKVKTFCLC